MNWEIAQLEKAELVKILEFDIKLDALLDKGLIRKKDLHHRLNEALNLLCYTLEKHKHESGKMTLSSSSVYYMDHFRELRVIMKNLPETDEKAKIEEVFQVLESKGLSGRRTESGDLAYPFPGDSYTPEIIIRGLEVFDKKIGFVMLEGKNLDYFCCALTEQFAKKIDTLIYAQNRTTVEELKNSSLAETDAIFDSDLPMDEKYSKVLNLTIKNSGAAGGYLTGLREGELKIVCSGFSGMEFPMISDEQALKICMDSLNHYQDVENILRKEIELEHGSLFAIVLKPGSKPPEGVLLLQYEKFTPERKEIALAFASAIDSSMHIERLYRVILHNFIHTLGEIIDTFDTYTSGHSGRVADYAEALGKAMNLTEIEMTKLHFASILHDIGKIGVDPGIIRKTSRLSEDERKIVENHARFSGSILDGVFPFDLGDIHDLAMSHHEKEDGTGYPNRLKGEQIPLLSKIISVADIFDALTSDRPYHRGRTREQACEMLKKEAENGKISPVIVGRFTSEEVWNQIKSKFFDMKIHSSFDYFRKEMLPDLKALEKDIKFNEKCLADLKKIEDNYNQNEAIDPLFMEDSLLYPADKENLIQIEYRRDKDKYLQIISDIRKKHTGYLQLAEKKLQWEKEFSERYWHPDLVIEAEQIFSCFAGMEPDVMSPLNDIPNLRLREGENEGITLLELLENRLSKSINAKEHNGDYAEILSELIAVGNHIGKSRK
ncbi:MAG: HD domain-containing protein [Firmicutes bacterium]|nr:HD domain-containing protein [Bacillota bacterium]